MHNYVCLNGRLLKNEDAAISPLTCGFMYGMGLFETIKVVNRIPLFYKEHLRRLRLGARRLSLNIEDNMESIEKECFNIIDVNKSKGAALKIIIFEDKVGPSRLLYTRPSGYNTTDYNKGYRLKIKHTRGRSGSISSVKTLNYLENVLEIKSAKREGFDEVIFLDEENIVLEGSMTNIFLVKKGRIITPSTGRIIPGIIRAILLKARHGVDCYEATLVEEDLFEADEAFLTNSLMGVMPILAIEDHYYNLDKNLITRELKSFYNILECNFVKKHSSPTESETSKPISMRL
jgi:branched-subunit amino acid aminotransferase/4-amino-4-deoxychorismate lyase